MRSGRVDRLLLPHALAMGRMQFIVPRRDRLPEGAIELAYLANHEESPYRTRSSWQGDRLTVERDEAESATLTTPWLVGERPPLALTTGTLIERPRPYVLPVELARGTIYRLRTYASIWQSLGLVLPEQVDPLLRRATQTLGRAATTQSDAAAAADLAQQALESALAASALLCGAYGEQSMIARRRTTPRAPILIGATLDDRPPQQEFAEPLSQACNTLAVPFTWRNIEPAEGSRNWQVCEEQITWCHARGFRICGGPLLRLDAEALPDWLSAAAEFESLMIGVERHLQAVVERYRGRVQLWNCAAGLSTARGLPLNEEQRLRLAVRAIEVVRAADANTPIVLTLDQPWGEYLRDERRQLSPIHVADVLVRGELGLSGVGLRINAGLAADATLPRDVLEISRQIDRFSVFNLPLLIEFTLPADVSAESAWIELVVPVLLGKPAVQAIFWGRLSDNGAGPSGEPDRFADRGLFDREGQPKPAWHALKKIRPWVE